MEQNRINLDKRVKIGCVRAILLEQLNKKLFGNVLTIVDASVSDLASRKAVKSLISQGFSQVSRNIEVELNNLQEDK